MMESFGCKCILANHKMSEYYAEPFRLLLQYSLEFAAEFQKIYFLETSFTVIEFEQYKLDELKARIVYSCFLLLFFFKFNLTEITDEVLSKEKGWFPRHCVVRIDEEESASKKDD